MIFFCFSISFVSSLREAMLYRVFFVEGVALFGIDALQYFDMIRGARSGCFGVGLLMFLLMG